MVLEVRVVTILGGDMRRQEGSFCYTNNLFLDLSASYNNVLSLCKSIKQYITIWIFSVCIYVCNTEQMHYWFKSFISS